MHHAIILEVWSRGDQALIEVPVMNITGLWSHTRGVWAFGPHTCGVWAMVPMLEGTCMGMHRRMHNLHYRYMQKRKRKCICASCIA